MALSLSRLVPVRTSLRIRRETGWPDVARGLTLIFRGYVLFVVCMLLGAGLLWLIADRHSEMGRLTKKLLGSWEAGVYLGLAIGLGGPFLAGGMVLLGRWRCLSYAPERHGAKSLILCCTTSLLLGLVLLVAGVLAFLSENVRTIRYGWHGEIHLDLSLPTLILECACFGVFIISDVFFVLFLRAVAFCLRDEGKARHADLYLVFTAFLVGGSLYIVLGNPALARQPEFLIMLTGCWVLYYAWHTLLVYLLRAHVRINQHALAPAAKR